MIYIWLLAIAMVILDITGLMRFTAKFSAGIILLFMPHIYLVCYHLNMANLVQLKAPLIFLTVYTFLRLGIKPIKRHKTISHRLNFLFAGKRLLNLGIYTTLMQIPLYTAYFRFVGMGAGKVIVYDGILCYLIICATVFNGMLRIICTSKWLNVFKRLVCIWFVLVPIANIVVMFYLRHISAKEYDYFVYKLDDMPKEIENQICATNYPILLVHGVGFRDARYFNYWGRIPKELRKRGTKVFYGNQEGWATVEYNAELLHQRALDILKETGAERINIIAHSKGGLDCRLMISRYNMGDKVASLTTMGTPHFGVKFADVLLSFIPEGFVNLVSKIINNIFRKYGDTNPDFKNAVMDLTEKKAAEFNKTTPNSPQVYYQSYSSVMKWAFSDYILTIPFIIGCLVGTRENDGLVPEPSAHWGHFCQTLTNTRLHGISHGDLIDLKRDDYRGFDIISKYVEIVSELKKQGF